MFPTLKVGKRGSENSADLFNDKWQSQYSHIGLIAKPGYLPQANNWDIHMYEFLNVYVT